MATSQLISSFGRKGPGNFSTGSVPLGLDKIQADIEDSAYLSQYFQVVQINPVFTAGKNSIAFNGSNLLHSGSQIQVECLDANGNSLYLASPPSTSSYIGVAKFTVAIYVFAETANGAGKVILVGTTAKNEVVRWTSNITINNALPNVTPVVFYNAPALEALPKLYPVIESTTGSVLGQRVTVTGQCDGHTREQLGRFFVSYFVNGPDSDYRVVAQSIVSDSPAVTQFNSQMVGQDITLYITTVGVSQPSWNWGQYWGSYENHSFVPVNSTQSFKIKAVISPTEIQLSGDVIDPTRSSYNTRLAPSFHGSFSMSYVNISHISQNTTTPANGSSNGGTFLVQTNNSVFTSSIVGESIQLNYGVIGVNGPTGYQVFDTSISTSYNLNPVTGSNVTITNYIDPQTIRVTQPNYTVYVANAPFTVPILSMTGSVTFLTASTPYQYYSTVAGSSSLVQKSYVDITYRNVDTFSGTVARHKLYAKSNIYPGDFTLISDAVLGPTEYLTDQTSPNKAFASMGTFYSQDQINQYWFASSASLRLVYDNTYMLNSMAITSNTPDYSAANGNSYVIAKAFSINVINDAVYYPFDELEFEQFIGTGYTSNFMFLPKNSWHLLSANVVIRKNPSVTAKVSFYFTSSSPGISKETTFDPQYGMKIGEIEVTDKVPLRLFPDIKKMYFRPTGDYYGTLVIVPSQCNVILANVSIKNYGDYGYSPEALKILLPFPVNVANESFTLKSELLDQNSNLIYTTAPVVQTFDPAGASLFGSSILGSVGSSGGIPATLPTLTVQTNLFLPGIPTCPSLNKRLLGFNIPTHFPPLSGEGGVCYTNITDLKLVPTNTGSVVTTNDYIELDISTPETGRALSVKYSGTGTGKRIFINAAGVKQEYS